METRRAPSTPRGLGPGGSKLWRGVVREHDLSIEQLAQLEEACRAKDRLDKLDLLLSGDVSTWVEIESPEGKPSRLVIDRALAESNATANLMKQLIAALRLPDAEGKKPQFRGARGSYVPKGAAPLGTISSIERARRRAGA